MFKILIFSIFICINFICAKASQEHDIFVRILKEIRFENGVAPETEKITGYKADLEAIVSELKPYLLTPDVIVPYYLSKDVAFFCGEIDRVTDVWSTQNLTKILHHVLENTTFFLVDEAYETTALSFEDSPKTPKTKQMYILLFSLSREAVIAQMPWRVRSIRASEVPYLGVYQDRLCTEAKPELNQLAKILRTEPSKAHILKNTETYRFVNVSVPKCSALSWNHILAYLVWHCDEAKLVAAKILDTKNFSMGMDFEWKFDTTDINVVSSVEVAMIFEKICTTGDKSYYLPVLDVLKKARATKPVPNDSLANAYPDLEANTSAENCAVELGSNYLQSGTTAPDLVHLHAVKIFDTARAGKPEYELEVFKEVLEDWIDKARTDLKISTKLYTSCHKHVGFGITIVRKPQEDGGKPNPAYWSVSLTVYE